MTDYRPKTDQPDRGPKPDQPKEKNAPGSWDDPSKRTGPTGQGGNRPQPRNPDDETAGRTGSRDPEMDSHPER